MKRIACNNSLNPKTQRKESLENAFLFIFKGLFLTFILCFALSSTFVLGEAGNGVESVDGGEGGDDSGDEESPKPLDKIIEKCKDASENTRSQVEDVNAQDSANMAKSTQQATDAGKTGIKEIHQLTAGINSALAMNAQGRCSRCKKAIDRCQKKCNEEKQCKTIVHGSYICKCEASGDFGCPYDSFGQPNKECVQGCEGDCSTCKDELEDLLIDRCESNIGKCELVCQQVGSSLMEALKHLMAAKQMGNCEGDDCSKLPPVTKEDNPFELPPNPNSPQLSNPSPMGASTPNFYGDGDAVGSNPAKIGELSGTQSSLDKKDDKSQNLDPSFQADVTDDFRRRAISGIKGNSLNPSAGFSSSRGGAGVSPSGSLASYPDQNNNSDPDKKFKYKEGEGEPGFNQQGFSSGGSVTGYQASAGSNPYSGNSYRGRRDRDKESKRDLSGGSSYQKGESSANSQDSIFIRASRLIGKFCSGTRC